MSGFGPNKSVLTTRFEKTFSADHLTDQYPILTAGLESGIVHYLFQSYYVLLGNELGFQPVIEYPFFDEDYRRIIGKETTQEYQKYSDVSWLSDDGDINCAIEFEKFDSKPSQKARNLIRYTEQQSDLDLVVLHYWNTNSQVTSRVTDQIKTELRDGYEYHQPAADTMLIETAFLDGTENGHTFTQILDVFPQE